jgi:hypothetical protein
LRVAGTEEWETKLSLVGRSLRSVDGLVRQQSG